jgi:hypothetical protein
MSLATSEELPSLKFAANRLVAEAREAGKISRHQPCEQCGYKGFTVAHHDDYSKPLEVRFLCGSCHAKWHRQRAKQITGLDQPYPSGWVEVADAAYIFNLTPTWLANNLELFDTTVFRQRPRGKGKQIIRLESIASFFQEVRKPKVLAAVGFVASWPLVASRPQWGRVLNISTTFLIRADADGDLRRHNQSGGKTLALYTRDEILRWLGISQHIEEEAAK